MKNNDRNRGKFMIIGRIINTHKINRLRYEKRKMWGDIIREKRKVKEGGNKREEKKRRTKTQGC